MISPFLPPVVDSGGHDNQYRRGGYGGSSLGIVVVLQEFVVLWNWKVLECCLLELDSMGSVLT